MARREDQILRYGIDVASNKGLLDLAVGLDKIVESGGPAAEQAQKLQAQLKALAEQDSLIKQFVSEKAALSDLGDEINRAGARLNELQAKISATANPSATLRKEFASAQNTLQTLTGSFSTHEAALARTSNALEVAGVSTKNLDAAQRTVQSSIESVAAQAATLGGHMKSTAEETEHAGEKAKEAGGFFSQLRENFVQIVEILGAVELALKAFEFGSEAVRGAAEVEASLSRVKALAQGSAEQFAEFGRVTEEAAVEVNTSTKDATAALAALVSQGLSADKAIGALVPTLQLAKVSNEDVATAAAQVATTLKAFNLPASEAQKVVDELTVASHGAAGGLGAIANAASQLAPDAKQLKLTFTDTVGILGELSAQGVDSEKAVRGLRTVFQELENPTSKLRGDLLALGDGSKGFGEAVKALTANTPQARDALNGLSGEARAVVLALGQAGPDALAKFTASLENANGEASRTSKLIDDNLSGAYKSLKNSVDRAAESLAEPVLEPFKEELEKLSKQVEDFRHSADFEDIRKDISEFAHDAVRALDELIKNTDWKGFASNAKEAILQIKADFAALADSARTIATVIGKGADVIGIGVRSTAAGLDLLDAAGAKAGQAVTTLVEKGAEFVGVSKESTDAIGKFAGKLGQFASGEFDAAGKQIGKITDNVKDLAGESSSAAESIPKIAGAVRDAGNASEHAAEQTGKHIEAVQGLALALQPIPKLSDSLLTAGTASKNFAEQLAQAAKTAAEFKDKSGNAVTGAEAVKTALANLGSVSQESLQQAAKGAASLFAAVEKGSADTAAGLADRRSAFLQYAQVALAASASLDEGVKAQTRSDLEAKAAALGLTDALKLLEAQSSRTGNAITDAALKASEAWTRQIVARQKASAETFNASVQENIAADKSAQATDKLEKSLTDYGDAADAAALATEGVTANTSHANDALAALDNKIGEVRQGFLATSDAAAKFFDTTFSELFKLAPLVDGSGLDKVAESLAEATQITTDKIAEQRKELQDQITTLDQYGAAGVKNFDATGDAVQRQLAGMKNLSALIASGNYQFGLLGQQDLAPLKSALDSAISRTQQLVDAAKQAADQFKSIGQQLQDELDQANGNNTAVENRRFQAQLEQLKKLAEAAGKLNSAQYEQDVANAIALHKLRLKQIAEQQAAQNGGSKPTTPSGSSGTPGIGGGNGDGSGGGGGGFGGPPVTQHNDFTGALFLTSNKQELQDFLADIVTPGLQRKQALNSKPLLGR